MKYLLTIIALCAAIAVAPDAQAHRYEQGNVSLSAGGALRVGGGETIFVAGLGAGYYVVDGLEVGLSSTAFFGADPFVVQLTPGVRYIFWMVPYVHPYLGAFYRHWFVSGGFPDLDSIGGRAGVVIASKGPLSVGAGVVYERVISPCASECDRIYPELTISLVF